MGGTDGENQGFLAPPVLYVCRVKLMALRVPNKDSSACRRNNGLRQKTQCGWMTTDRRRREC